MATNRILEFTPSQEEAIVARILVLLHQAVDEHFPAAEKATRQFTKTVFSDDGERTALGAPGEAAAHGFGNEEKTGPGDRPPEGSAAGGHAPPRDLPSHGASGHAEARPGKPPGPPTAHVPAPPSSAPMPVSIVPTAPIPRPVSTSPHPAPAATGGMSAASALSWMSGMTGLEKRRRGSAEGRDWVTMATLALLVAGLILLAYSFLV